MPDLLIELFSEEIPARMQARAADDLRRLVTDGLVEAGLTYAHAAGFATPRRLALAIEGLLAESPVLREERRGPRADAPPKAIEGFLRATGLARDQLETRETPKGQVLFATIERPGRPAAEVVAEVLGAAIRDFPWPKSMRWGAGSAEAGALRWVRPLHRILCILSDEHGAQVVPLEVGGLAAGTVTEGHRFMAPEAFSVTSFDDYRAKLRRARVILSAEERAQTIWHDATQAAFARGLTVVDDRGLLAEVAGLVEWPVVLMGEIDPRFLDLPPEVLRTSMKEHQKFFSVGVGAENDKNVQLSTPRFPTSVQNAPPRITHFVTVANRETADDGATILAGNRKVLTARLEDASFFWRNDLRVARGGIEAWRRALDAVTFHARLGSQGDRIDRIAALAREVAPAVGADPDLAARAAAVAKLDLASEMVYEFPELQGVMGRYYAEAAGESPEVAAAAEAHYAPLGPSDAVPTEPVSVAVALADKLDTLAGFWAIDETPTGSRDPFALRRAALGVIRLVLENGVRLPLVDAIDAHAARMVDDAAATLTEDGRTLDRGPLKRLRAQHDVAEMAAAGRRDVHLIAAALDADTVAGLLGFLHDRLKVHLRERGIRHDVIDAVLAMPGSDDLTLVVRRAKALGEVLKTEDGENLVQGFRRANNILIQAEAADGVEYSFGADRKWAEADEERALFDALDVAEERIARAMEAEDHAAAMTAMAVLRAPIDAFFEAVQVNTDSQTIRRNRLNLLNRIRAVCLQVADLARLEG